MRKGLVIMVAALLAAGVYQPTVISQELITDEFIDGDPRWEFGVNTSLFVPGNEEFEYGFYVGGVASYDLLRYLAVGIEGGWTHCELEGNDKRHIADFNGGSVLGDIILKAPLDFYDFVFVPYGVLGLGVWFSDIDETDAVKKMGKIETDPAFLIKGGGGFQVILNENIVFYIEGSYIFAKIDFQEKFSAGQTVGFNETKDVDAGYFGGGLKVRF